MPLYSPSNSPEQNLAILAENPYPGRLLVVGFAGSIAVQAYAVEGRSNGSRNRRLVLEDNIVSTEIVDPSAGVGDPELTIYDAMRSVDGMHIVSNGNQTDRVARYRRSGIKLAFEAAMEATEHEPDTNHTPRITGFHDSRYASAATPKWGLSVIRKDPGSDGSIRRLFTDHHSRGRRIDADDYVGHCVHTYEGDGDPLPSFNEAPFRVPTQDTATEMAAMIWENLDRQNRVAVAAKTISSAGLVDFAIINRHK